MNDTPGCLSCPTRRSCLAAGLADEALQALAGYVLPSRPLRRGEQLYRAGDTAEDCFVVRSGTFKTMVVSADGDEHVTGFHFPGEIMGTAGQARGEHHDSAVALETSTACRVPLEQAGALWSLGCGRNLLRLLGRAEQQRATDHTNLSRTAADARVAGFLLDLSDRMRRLGRSDTHLPVPMSRTDLANYLGMTLECLSRVLARLDRAGLISRARRQIDVLRTEALERLGQHLDR